MTLLDTLAKLISRQVLWRLSRRLYMKARGEVPNGMYTNGEKAALSSILDFFKLNIQNGECHCVIFDVGANVGEWSEMALSACSLRGVAGKIYGFEPVPSTFSKLNARLGDFSQFEAHQLALSNSIGSRSFHVSGPNAGTNSFYPSDETLEVIEIPTDTGVAFFERQGLDTLHFLKIDAEGHDLEVIRGFKPLLDLRKIWILQFEYNHRWLYSHSSLFSLFNLLEGTYYTVARLTPNRLETFDGWVPEMDRFFEANYCLVRNDILPKLPHVIGHFGPSNVWEPKV